MEMLSIFLHNIQLLFPILRFKTELCIDFLFVFESLPHAFCGFVLVVAVELRRSQHCLGEHRQEAEGLHEQHRVQEEVGGVGRHQREGQNTLKVVHKATPGPEVGPVKVCAHTDSQKVKRESKKKKR